MIDLPAALDALDRIAANCAARAKVLDRMLAILSDETPEPAIVQPVRQESGE